MNYYPSNKDISSLKTEADVEDFIRKWCTDEVSFHEALNQEVAVKGITLPDLMEKSRINRNYGYNIVNGRRTNPGRDKVIALCIAAGLSVEETQNLLSVAKVGGLYYRRERDIRIASCLNNGIRDVLDVNILLESHDLEPLDV